MNDSSLDIINPDSSSANAPEPPLTPQAPASPPAPQHLPRVGPSFGWLLLFFVLFFASAVFYVVGYGAVLGYQSAVQGVALPDPAQIEVMIQEHLGQPNGLAGLYLLQCLILLPVIAAVAHFRTQHWSVTLGFRRFAVQSLAVWMMIWLAYLAITYVINLLADVDPGDFMRSLNGSQHFGAALVLVIGAPLLEELIFRGYLFKAWRHSRLGLSGTLLLTSLLFTALHLSQYNWIYLSMIFVLSLILGLAREKSGSIWVPLAIHAANNLVATVTIIYLGML